MVQNLRIVWIKMLISSNLFVLLLSTCHYDSRYVGRISQSQRLQCIIKQHVSNSIRSDSSSRKTYFLPVGANLLPRLIPSLLLLIQPLDFIFYKIVQHYDDSRFFILAQRRSPCHLSALKATFIKTSNPTLGRQHYFLYS